MRPGVALATIVALLAASCAGGGDRATTRTPALDALAMLSAQRLQLADAVAANKAVSGKPVQDTARETAQLARLAAQAEGQGIDPQAARVFFVAQIEAGKRVQYALLGADRRPHAVVADAPPLDAIRARLDRLNTAMLAHLAPARVETASSAECPRRVAVAIDRARAQSRLDALHATALARAFDGFCRRD